jgi:hypothetical protein
MLKNHATQTMQFCADQAVQILGGMGFMRGTVSERIYREVKVMMIGGGAEEIMKDLAAQAARLARSSGSTSMAFRAVRVLVTVAARRGAALKVSTPTPHEAGLLRNAVSWRFVFHLLDKPDLEPVRESLRNTIDGAPRTRPSSWPWWPTAWLRRHRRTALLSAPAC